MQAQSTKTVLELSVKAVLLGVFLAAVLVVSNTYLALKIGVLTASSIPAAILSMGILRLFKRHTLLENNAVQTCASAGEAIAGGIVYTAPALIILHIWADFSYWQTAALTLIGGGLGVLFTIPLRRLLVHQPQLPFPEAQAIAKVLQQEGKRTSMRPLFIGGLVGSVVEVAQNGLKLLADQASFWWTKGHVVMGFGVGFSATLLGAGYLMGIEVGLSILLGALIAYVLVLPIDSFYHVATHMAAAGVQAQSVIDHTIRYVGIGAMLLSGLWTLLTLLPTFYRSTKAAVSGFSLRTQTAVARTERDLPGAWVLLGIVLLAVCLCLTFMMILPLPASLSSGIRLLISLGLVFFVLVIGFIASAICAYFSGLVGVAASPGSAVGIGSVLLAVLCVVPGIHLLMHHNVTLQHHAALGIVAMLSAVVMGAACVANNNSQDLKVGQLVGATPWKQQIMLLLGALAAGLLVPAVMQVLFHVYGIAHVGGSAGVSSLPAPPAAAMAAIAQAAVTNNLLHQPLYLGMGIIFILAVLRHIFPRGWVIRRYSLIGVAIGIYLPLSSSVPLFLGAMVGYLASRRSSFVNLSKQAQGTVLACGLVAGAAVTNVLLAVPLALSHRQIFSFTTSHPAQVIGVWGGALVTLLVMRLLYRATV